jgi:hypothetical protein
MPEGKVFTDNIAAEVLVEAESPAGVSSRRWSHCRMATKVYQALECKDVSGQIGTAEGEG